MKKCSVDAVIRTGWYSVDSVDSINLEIIHPQGTTRYCSPATMYEVSYDTEYADKLSLISTLLDHVGRR